LSPAELALDVAVPAAVGGGVWLALSSTGRLDGPFAYALIAIGLALPSAALVAWRDRPFVLDSYFASTSGSILGTLAGALIANQLFPVNSLSCPYAPDGTPTCGQDLNGGFQYHRLALQALGQGLGAAAGYHIYRLAKPNLTDLDRLPEHRTDDPLNWDRWKERHHNE
jgi:hypothetical protein